MQDNNFYKNNPLLPKAFTSRQYTKEEMEEFKKCYQDIVYFANNYFYALDSNTGIIGKIKLYDYQLEALEKFRDIGRLTMLTSRQAGKLLPCNTKIPLFQGGFKTINDITVGDRIIGSDGKSTTVIYKSPRQNPRMFKITFDDGNVVDACENHLWTVRNKLNNNNSETKDTKTLYTDYKSINPRGYERYKYAVDNIKPVQYSEKQVKITPYQLGIWLGKGDLTFDSRELQHYNLIGNKHIPDDYLYGSIQQRTDLLHGLMDYCGKISKDNIYSIRLTNKNKQLVDDVVQLLASIGIKVFKTVIHNKRYDSYSTRLTFGTQLSVFKNKKVVINNNVTRKKYNQSRTIIKIEQIENAEGYCIQVDAQDSLFAITDNYILTHNTTVATVIILHTALFNKDKTLALLANFQSTAIEILDRIKEAYENLPKFLKQGILIWNRKTVKFENGCTIFANASKGSSIRGQSIYLLYVDECVGGNTKVTVKNKYTGEVASSDIRLLYDKYIHYKQTNNKSSFDYTPIDDLEVLTENGFKSFDGIKKSTTNKYINIYFNDDTKILCTYNHKFLFNKQFTYASELSVGDILNDKTITNIEYIDSGRKEDVYDLINVSDGNHYITNGVTSHNCAFVQNWELFASSTLPTITANKDAKIIYTSCVTDDTFVWSDKGLQQVKDFVDYNQIDHPRIGYNVPEYSVVGMNKLNHGSVVVNSGLTKTKTITTAHSSLTGSLQHKLYACVNGVYGWYKLQQLSVGDYVSIRYGFNHWVCNDDLSDIKLTDNDSKGKNTFIVPDKMTTDISYILGYYLTDDNTSYHHSTLDETSELIQSLKKCNLPVVTYDDLQHNVCCKDFVEFMIKYGFDLDKKSYNKVIPQRMTQSSPEIIKSFLRGLFDRGRSMSLINNTVRISLTSTSEMLIDQVRMILQNFGILTHKYHKTVEKHHAYVLEICGQYVDLFNDLIGFDISTKKLKQTNTRSTNRTNEDDVIPYFFPLLEQHNIKLKSDQKREKQTDCSRELALQHIGDKLPNICSKQIVWEKINDIRYGENKVYDFSLDDVDGDDWCHSVLYNGYIGHQTPNGLNHFYDYCRLAKAGISGYGYIEVPWYRVNGRDEKWKENTLKDLNYNYEAFEAEYNCQFLGSSGTLISGSTLKLLQPKQPIYTHDNLKVYEKAQENHVYVIAIDSSKGVGLDYHAFSVIDITKMPYVQVAAFKDNQMSPYDYATLINQVGRMYNNGYLLIELNCPSGAIVAEQLFWQFEYENILMTTSDSHSNRKVSMGFGDGKVDRGIYTTATVKSVGCSMLKMLVEQQQLIINDKDTIEETKTFSKKGKSYEAEEGKHDDLIMGLVLFAWLTNQDFMKQLADNDVSAHLKTKSDQDIDDYVNGLGVMVTSNDHSDDQDIVVDNSFYIPY